MKITTITEARALVGRTFERDGKARTFLRVSVCECGSIVVWRLCGATRARFGLTLSVHQSGTLDEFNDWLSGATEVPE